MTWSQRKCVSAPKTAPVIFLHILTYIKRETHNIKHIQLTRYLNDLI